MATLSKAIEIAARFHGDTLDKGGNPYIEHCMRVANRCTNPKAKRVGWIHDTLEDTTCTRKFLIECGFDEEELHALDCVTKRYGETYGEFILRSASDLIAREVKIADLLDNMDFSRLPLPPKQKDFDRVAKYARALAFLQGKTTELGIE